MLLIEWAQVLEDPHSLCATHAVSLLSQGCDCHERARGLSVEQSGAARGSLEKAASSLSLHVLYCAIGNGITTAGLVCCGWFAILAESQDLSTAQPKSTYDSFTAPFRLPLCLLANARDEEN